MKGLPSIRMTIAALVSVRGHDIQSNELKDEATIKRCLKFASGRVPRVLGYSTSSAFRNVAYKMVKRSTKRPKECNNMLER